MGLRNRTRRMTGGHRLPFLFLLLGALLILAGCAHRGSTGDTVYGSWRLTNYEEFEALNQEAGAFVDGFWCFDVNPYDGSGTLGSSVATELSLYNDGKFLAVCNHDKQEQISGTYSIKEGKITLSDVCHGNALFSLNGSEDFLFTFSDDTLSITGSAGVFQFMYQRYDSAAEVSDSGESPTDGSRQDDPGMIGEIVEDLLESDPIAGVYEEENTIWSFAKDGTLRLVASGEITNVYIGSWYISNTDSALLAIKLDWDWIDGGKKVEYELHGDEMDLFLDTFGESTCKASLRRVGAAPKTAGIAENRQTTLSGVYLRTDSYFETAQYTFYQNGEFEFAEIDFLFTETVQGTYKIVGNDLTLNCSDGYIEQYSFERLEDGLLLFGNYDDGYPTKHYYGRYFQLVESLDNRPSPATTPVPTPVPTEKPGAGTDGKDNPTNRPGSGSTQETAVGSVTVLVNALRVRSAPNTSGSELGKTTKGETFRVYAVSQAEGYTWYRIGKDAWIADKNGDYASFSKDTSPTSWDLDASIGMVEILTDSVQMSIAPSTRAEKTVWTAKGDQYWVYEISYAEYAEGYLWYRIGPDAWVADKDGKSVRYSDRIALLIAQAQGITPNKNDPMTFLGHTLGEVIKAFGDGYSTEDFGISGPYPGLFYPDNRTPYVFLYVDAYEKLGGRQIDQNDLDMDFVVADVGIYDEIMKQAESAQGEYAKSLRYIGTNSSGNSVYLSKTVEDSIFWLGETAAKLISVHGDTYSTNGTTLYTLTFPDHPEIYYGLTDPSGKTINSDVPVNENYVISFVALFNGEILDQTAYIGDSIEKIRNAADGLLTWGEPNGNEIDGYLPITKAPSADILENGIIHLHFIDSVLAFAVVWASYE